MKRDLPNTAAIFKSSQYNSMVDQFRRATAVLESDGGIGFSIRHSFSSAIRHFGDHNPYSLVTDIHQDEQAITLEQPGVAAFLDHLESDAVHGHHGYVHFSRRRFFLGEWKSMTMKVHVPIFLLHAHLYDRWQERVLSLKDGQMQMDNPYKTADFSDAVKAGCAMLFWSDASIAGQAHPHLAPIMLPLASGGLMLGTMAYKGTRYFTKETITYRSLENGELLDEASLPTGRWEPSREIYLKTLINGHLMSREQKRVFERMRAMGQLHRDVIGEIYFDFAGNAMGTSDGRMPVLSSAQRDPMKAYKLRLFLRDCDELIKSPEWQICSMRSLSGGHTLRL